MVGAADAAGMGSAFLIPLGASLAIAALAVPLTGGRSRGGSGGVRVAVEVERPAD